LDKKKNSIAPFIIGFICALIFGWYIFPYMLYSKEKQPFNFSHKAHLKLLGSCEACHFFREDGSFNGIPDLQSCKMCHYSILRGTPDEKIFFNEYLKKNKEIPWKVYQKQPDNVYFSHIAHKNLPCTTCHPDVGHSDITPVFYRNKITGYSKYTMKMYKCERCHAKNKVSNACYVCHK